MQDRLAEAADDLYALAPGDFRAARDERADQARAAGDRELAGAIRKLRRPTVSAWLVNRLVRDAGDQIGELLRLGGDLREAQSALAGDRLRELSQRRRTLMPALAREARRLADDAGQPVSDQAERELTGTLEAALADRAAADAVRSGRLTTALSYAGMGDAFGAAAAPDGEADAARRQAPGGGRDRRDTGRPAGRGGPGRAKAEPARGGRGARGGREQDAGRAAGSRAAGDRGADDRAARAAEDRAAREAEAARRDLDDAEAAAREAAGALAAAEQQAATTAGQHEAAVQRVAGLERELDEAQSAELRASRAAREARRERDGAARSLQAALRRLARARERAGRDT